MTLPIILTGCLTFEGMTSPNTYNTTTTSTSISSPQSPSTEEPREFPDAPDTITNSTAKQVALDYEEVYIYNVLQQENYSEWGVGNWNDSSATVLNRTQNGIYVQVRMPYSYQYESGYVDGVSQATYFITTETIERVKGDGIDPL